MGWAILIGVLVIGGVIVAAIVAHHKREQEARRTVCETVRRRKAEQEECCERLGAPVFEEVEGAKQTPMTNPASGMVAWCATPYGIMRGKIGSVGPSAAIIDTGEYTISIKMVPNYFSATMAGKLGIEEKAWIVQDIRREGWTTSYVQGMGRKFPPTIAQSGSSTWLRHNTIFGDFLDIMVEQLWFELMFGGFSEPVEYYEEIEPIRDDGEPTGDVTNWTTEEERRFAEDESRVADAMESIEESQSSFDPTTTSAMFPDSPPNVTPEPAYEPPEEPKRDYSPPAPEPSSGGWFSGGGGDSGGSDYGGGDSGGSDD